MNNYYYILSLVLFFAVLYYCFSSDVLTENFADTTVSLSGGTDDTSAINALAQLANKLMNTTTGLIVPGTLTVGTAALPAPLNVTGQLSVGGAPPYGPGSLNAGGVAYNTRIGGIWHLPGIYAENGKNLEVSAGGGTVYIGSSVAGEQDTNLIVQGNSTVNKNSTVTGNLTVTGATTTTGNINAGGTYNTRIGDVWASPGVYAEGTKNLIIAAGGGTVFVGKADGTVANNLTVTGNLTVLDPDMFKSQVAGYYHISAAVYKVPLYYGINMMWNDGDFAERNRNAYGFTTTQVHFTGLDMRNGNDGSQVWMPRGLVVNPGYQIKLFMGNGPPYNALGKSSFKKGSYSFSNSDFSNYRAHVIIVTGASETELANNLKSQ